MLQILKAEFEYYRAYYVIPLILMIPVFPALEYYANSAAPGNTFPHYLFLRFIRIFARDPDVGAAWIYGLFTFLVAVALFLVFLNRLKEKRERSHIMLPVASGHVVAARLLLVLIPVAAMVVYFLLSPVIAALLGADYLPGSVGILGACSIIFPLFFILYDLIISPQSALRTKPVKWILLLLLISVFLFIGIPFLVSLQSDMLSYFTGYLWSGIPLYLLSGILFFLLFSLSEKTEQLSVFILTALYASAIFLLIPEFMFRGGLSFVYVWAGLPYFAVWAVIVCCLSLLTFVRRRSYLE